MIESLAAEKIASQEDPPASQLPPHLFPLPDSNWALWRCVGLRGAGFPAARVLRLSAPECAAIADSILQHEDGAEKARAAASGAIDESLDQLRRTGQWGDQDQRVPLLKGLWNLAKGKAPQSIDGCPKAQASLDQMNVAKAGAQSAWAELRQAFDTALKRQSDAIGEEAGNPRFQEAIIWQNRSAFNTGIKHLVQRAGAETSRGSKQRQREEIVASYLQRYCAKNDTIGFFGPVGWAELTSQVEGIAVNPGSTFLAQRNLYFEVWSIDALSQAIDKEKRLRYWLAPRMMPAVYLEGATAHISSTRPIRLSPQEAAILKSCDGVRTAGELAVSLSQDPQLGLNSEDKFLELLENMQSMGLVRWELEVPMELYPERSLRQLLERVEDESLRSPAIEALNQMESAREAIREVDGDPEALDQAFQNLETTFARLTGLEATRSAGMTYAARTLVYEDCRRNVDVKIGPEVINAFAPALSLLLTSARWTTLEAAHRYNKAFKQIHDELSKMEKSNSVDFGSFWKEANPLLLDSRQSPSGLVARELQSRWADILSLPVGQRAVQYASEDLRPRVVAAFDASGPGWKQARYQCPDIMIAASSPEAIRHGDYLGIMGELHIGCNTLATALFTAQHPNPEDLSLAAEIDLPDPAIVPAISKTSTIIPSARLLTGTMTAKDYYLQLDPDPVDVTTNVLAIGALVVEREGDDLIVKTRDDRLRFGIIDVLAEFFGLTVTSCFNIVVPAKHTPRVTIDRLVVSRESWSFSPLEAGFAHEKSGPDRFVATRTWARGNGMPRFVFVKTPAEVKPFYVDFESPVYIDIFARLVRQAVNADNQGWIRVTEMLPTHDECWLVDADGEKYTSELRIVAVDLKS
jgi:Lantibiotic dehydratase, N terminus